MEEPKIWPIGKVFADFVAAHCGFNWDEYYSYHGTKKKCKREREPKPFNEWLITKYGAKWEPIYVRINTTEKTYTLDYNLIDFLPSGSWDKCAAKFPDGFERYYFCKIEIWDGTFVVGWAMDMNGIIPCRIWSRAGRYKYFRKTYVATIWAAKPWLVWIYQWVPNSRFIVWRSNNGDMPVDYPLPIEEYYEE